jgi:hypothetical protein
MGALITRDMRALWARLHAAGGWWTPEMLAPYWRPTFAPPEVQQALDALEANGFIESRDQASNLSYGVTPHCLVLPDPEPLDPWDWSSSDFINLTVREPHAPFQHRHQAAHLPAHPGGRKLVCGIGK